MGTARQAVGGPCGAGEGEEAAGAAARRWGEPADEACRMGGTRWYRQVTITEREGGVERKTNLTLPFYVWVWGETTKWPHAAEQETVAAFMCLFGMSNPPRERKNSFSLRVCLIDEASREYTGREVWQKLHRVWSIHQVGGYEAPQSACDATATWVPSYAPKGGRPTKYTKRGAEVVVVELDAPPTSKGKAPSSSP